MSIYIVRHAKAGNRSDWDGDDLLRPLSKNGWKQATAIAERLVKRTPSSLYSSPFVRCRQTLEPLAASLDLAIVSEQRLSEGSSFEQVLHLIADAGDGAVLCSHGDVIPETIGALQRRGCTIDSHPDWGKGTVWTIDRTDGEFVRAKVWAPPG